MKTTLLVTVSFTALATAPALAADLAARPYTKAPAPLVAPLPSWAGFYLGVNGGADWSRNCWTVNRIGGTAVIPTGEGCHSATSGVAGGQLGYRWQANNWVFGLEAQGDWTDLKASNVSAVDDTVTNTTKTDAIGLFTGQVGYAWNSVLWYVKGGAALTHNKYTGTASAAAPVPAGTYLDSASETRWGGTVGTGVEFAFAPGWSVAAEYDHLFMGRRDISFPANPGLILSRTDSIKQDVDMATVRVNYRFGSPVIARY
ncbi:outer membrane protein [Bradyrhizobium sp. STM 3557]|uniref:outer membrane protein n=1 Tax=Bradyrhizobium sp. STM 3557 TaxID=578920 RepID=UPI00388EF98C